MRSFLIRTLHQLLGSLKRIVMWLAHVAYMGGGGGGGGKKARGVGGGKSGGKKRGGVVYNKKKIF